MNLYDATVPVFTKYLQNMNKWIDKAVAYAESKKFDPEVLINARLAPDQHSFIGQVQSACDQAKWASAKLAGKQGPSNPDTEKTIPELRARITAVTDYLATLKREDFNGAEEREISHQWMQGKVMRGGDYLDHMALPNFHFHLVTGYAILRHNGVALGKTDFTGELPFKS